MNTKHPQRRTGRCLHLCSGIIILLLSILIFATPSPSQNSGKAIKVRIYTNVRPSDSKPFTAGEPISAEVVIGSYTATTSTTPEEGKIGIPETIITVPPGKYKVKARAEGYIVKEVNFSAPLAGQISGTDMAGVPATSTEGDVEIEVWRAGGIS